MIRLLIRTIAHLSWVASALLVVSPFPTLAAARTGQPARTGIGSRAGEAIAGSAMASRPAHTRLAPGDTVTVPLELSSGQPVVQAYLNGRGPYRMFLDTGAGTTVLDRSLATELGIAKRGETKIGDPANPQAINADLVLLDSLQIGGACFIGVQAASWDRAALRPGGDAPRGVVGFPVFHDLLETLDFPGATLRLTRGHLPPADGRAVLHYSARDGVPSIPIEVAGVTIEAHLDTGSPGFLSIPEKDTSRVRFAAPLREIARGRTVNSTVVFRGAPIDGTCRIGAIRFDRPTVLVHDQLPHANLGSRALRDIVVTLDQSAELVRFERTRVSPSAALEAGPGGYGGHGGPAVAGPAPGEKTAGVVLAPQPDGRLLVLETLPASAASRADLRAGDAVVRINGAPIDSLSHEQRLARLHHSPVTLTLLRDDRTLEITLEF